MRKQQTNTVLHAWGQQVEARIIHYRMVWLKYTNKRALVQTLERTRVSGVASLHQITNDPLAVLSTNVAHSQSHEKRMFVDAGIFFW